MTDLRVGCGIAWPLSFSEKINFLEVSSCCIIIDFRLVIIHHNGINELDMLVCMKLWLGHFYFYLLIQLFYVPWFHWHYHDTMTHDYNTRGKKDAGTFEDVLKSNENNLQKKHFWSARWLVKETEPSKCDIRLVSRILWHKWIIPSLKE